MYLTILSFAVALVVGVGSWLAGAGWFGGVFFGFLALVATWIIGARRMQKRLAPAMQQVQRQVEARMLQPALASLRAMLPMGNWMPLLKGQLYAQMGVLAYHGGDRDEALGYLEKAGRRSADAKMLLAAIRYNDGKVDEALTALRLAEPFNRRHVLLHNMEAWLLHKEGRTDEAMQCLNRLLKKEAGSEPTRDNLLRLQNGQKMNMKVFGVPWFMLGFETPPARMGEMQTGRKGFRQPPKRRGKR